MISNREVLEHAVVCFNEPSRRGEYLAVYAEDARLYGYHGVPPGRAGIAAFYEGIWAGIPDASLTLEHVIEAGDEVVARFVMTGRHLGTLMGVAATGLAVTMPGITILRFRDGLISERWSQADVIGLMMQVGAVALPGG